MVSTEVYLLDTNIASAAWGTKHKLHSVIDGKLHGIPNDYVFISAITVAEVEFGLMLADDVHADQQKQVRQAMSQFKRKDIDHHTAPVYGEIKAALYRLYAPKDGTGKRKPVKFLESLTDPITGKELGIQVDDLWIVSIAKQYNMVFVTDDRREGMNRIIEAAQYQGRTEYWGV